MNFTKETVLLISNGIGRGLALSYADKGATVAGVIVMKSMAEN
ncbi:hypothetical protein [Halobacillus naozhouensis]|uniref:Short chain dehydrogenase n=1 Tax=Halobacillus naozhouensis TaxID=554880 RepID=A0ABY8J528_9BACI|nr:hypothetical protein [Halobacillus naozhouensis]WFT76538.1 hypothetical protein P9989_09315 [Halobacillus naozhouensis]